MTQPLTITFDLASFNPERFGLTRGLVKFEPDLFAKSVSVVIAKIFKAIGRDA